MRSARPWLARRSFRASRSEDGFTIIEMMIALFLFAVGIVAVTSVFLAGLKTATVSQNRARALALAARDTEAFHALPYCSVGYSSTQLGGSTTWTDLLDTKTYTNVVVGNPLAAERAPSGPAETSFTGNQTYNFERHVLWADAPVVGTGTTDNQAYKRTVVIVNWKDQVGTHSVRHDSFLYPGGLGQYTVPANCPTTAPGNNNPPPLFDLPPSYPFTATTGSATCPAGQTCPPAARPGENEVDLQWYSPSDTSNVDHWLINYSFNNFATSYTLVDKLPVAAPNQPNTYAASGLAPNTTYSFQVFAVSPAGAIVASSVKSAPTLAASGGGPCGLTGAITASPAGQAQKAGGTALVGDFSVAVHTNAGCPAVELKYQPVAGGSTDTIVVLSQTSPGIFSGTMNGTATNWSIGGHTVNVVDQSGSPFPGGSTLQVTVCSAGAASCP
jgi:prepilin-type N-terminal cleavage/methylation domain-containing protein